MPRKWSKRCLGWPEGNVAFISVVFSWDLEFARRQALKLKSLGYVVRAGGPAVDFNPTALQDVATLGGKVKALQRHNPDATFTTRGCIRKCKFCVVPKVEGALVELPDSEWEPRSIVCDNNLLAASTRHFDHVIDRFLDSPVVDIDFNQGLDARCLTPHHAKRIAQLHHARKLAKVRLAWDNLSTEEAFRKAFEVLRSVGIPLSKIGVYVLIGYQDTPEDALYRLQEIRALRIRPNPMRYQPLGAQRRNEYTAPAWTDRKLKKYMRYFSRLRWTGSIPFDEFDG